MVCFNIGAALSGNAVFDAENAENAGTVDKIVRVMKIGRKTIRLIILGSQLTRSMWLKVTLS